MLAINSEVNYLQCPKPEHSTSLQASVAVQNDYYKPYLVAVQNEDKANLIKICEVCSHLDPIPIKN